MCKEQSFDYGNVTESYDKIDVEVCILFSVMFWLSYHNDGDFSKWKTQLVILLSGESNMKCLLVLYKHFFYMKPVYKKQYSDFEEAKKLYSFF